MKDAERAKPNPYDPRIKASEAQARGPKMPNAGKTELRLGLPRGGDQGTLWVQPVRREIELLRGPMLRHLRRRPPELRDLGERASQPTGNLCAQGRRAALENLEILTLQGNRKEPNRPPEQHSPTQLGSQPAQRSQGACDSRTGLFGRGFGSTPEACDYMPQL